MKIKYLFLQSIVILFGFCILTFLILFPLFEGRASHLNLFQIYLDYFILYIYLASFPFFDVIYRLLKLLENLKQNKWNSQSSLDYLRRIKNQTRILTLLILGAGIYIAFFHHPEDDPAGFLGLCILVMSLSFIVSLIASIFEKKLHHLLKF